MAGNAQTSVACIVSVVTLRCCRVSSAGVVLWLNSEAEARGQSHTNGKQGVCYPDRSGNTAGPIQVSQQTEKASGNDRRNVFLAGNKQETKASPLGHGAELGQMHLL